MFPPDAYQLLDFGDGRRLEQFGPFRLDRPCPTAEGLPRSQPGLWAAADARFERTTATSGVWHCRGELPERWTIARGEMVLELKRTEFGHLGIFPEQASNWDWIAAKVRAAANLAGEPPAAPLRVLNLFAYTGGSTLAAAAAGAEVVHVDAARNVVAWARRNAELSGRAEAPVRWIADDAQKFVRREIRRGGHCDAVILDPPSYGHGARGEVWRLSKHLPQLLALCDRLAVGRLRFLLLTCHTPDYDAPRLARLVAEAFPGLDPARIEAGPLALRATDGRLLQSGVVVRCDWSS
jgi:23S rRNA (cytosine1962-C5)-methyltransferase